MKKTATSLAVVVAVVFLSACQPKNTQPGPIERQATVTAGVKVVQP